MRMKSIPIAFLIFSIWLIVQAFIVLKNTEKIPPKTDATGMDVEKNIETMNNRRRETFNPTQRGGNMKITTVFEDGGNIPSQYTCDGENLAPELTISGVPENTQELVLIVDDPDAPAGTWVHWVVYNIPPETNRIDANNLPPQAKQGMTDFGKIGWGGPCPPNGQHRYFFKLYALNRTLGLPDGVTKQQVEEIMQDCIIEKTELIGLYKRI